MNYLIKMDLTNNLISYTWNCTTIKNKLVELEHFINYYNIDMCRLSETRLGPENKLKCKEYAVHRNDRNMQGGGVAVLIKSNTTIKYFILPNDPQFPTESIVFNLYTIKGAVIVVAMCNPLIRV